MRSRFGQVKGSGWSKGVAGQRFYQVKGYGWSTGVACQMVWYIKGCDRSKGLTGPRVWLVQSILSGHNVWLFKVSGRSKFLVSQWVRQAQGLAGQMVLQVKESGR